MPSKEEDNQIKLYGILVDQLTKYNTIIWQIPTALLAANILVLEKMISRPYIVLAIFIFNCSLIYAFHKMIIRQGAIIDCVRNSEKALRVIYPDFIPFFKVSKVRAPKVFVFVLSWLNLGLLIYFIILI